MTIQKLFKKVEAHLEITLGELENKYPTIPAIEVTIPHFLASFNLNSINI
jgi:hypothetical protein